MANVFMLARFTLFHSDFQFIARNFWRDCYLPILLRDDYVCAQRVDMAEALGRVNASRCISRGSFLHYSSIQEPLFPETSILSYRAYSLFRILHLVI
jgi:hypothetical protein